MRANKIEDSRAATVCEKYAVYTALTTKHCTVNWNIIIIIIIVITVIIAPTGSEFNNFPNCNV